MPSIPSLPITKKPLRIKPSKKNGNLSQPRIERLSTWTGHLPGEIKELIRCPEESRHGKFILLSSFVFFSSCFFSFFPDHHLRNDVAKEGGAWRRKKEGE